MAVSPACHQLVVQQQNLPGLNEYRTLLCTLTGCQTAVLECIRFWNNSGRAVLLNDCQENIHRKDSLAEVALGESYAARALARTAPTAEDTRRDPKPRR